MIEISYKLRDGNTPVVLHLTPEQYYDTVEAGESYENDGVPRFDHAWQYLGIPIDRFDWTVLRLSGVMDSWVRRTDFFCKGRSWLLHRSDADGYEELIHNTELQDGSTHIIRIHRTPDGAWAMNTNVVIRKDGTEEDFS